MHLHGPRHRFLRRLLRAHRTRILGGRGGQGPLANDIRNITQPPLILLCQLLVYRVTRLVIQNILLT